MDHELIRILSAAIRPNADGPTPRLPRALADALNLKQVMKTHPNHNPSPTAGPLARAAARGWPRWALVATLAVVLGAGLQAAKVAVADNPSDPTAPDEETLVRQGIVQTALGREKADLIIHGATVLNVFTLSWNKNQDIVVKGKRIAWVGPAGEWKGKCDNIFDATGLFAVPSFGEAHKHIESTNLSPEYEAALVIPIGNTWTIEGTHEFSNVSGPHNIEFWLMAGKQGSPLKIFPNPGSATPPTAFETGGGYYGYKEIREMVRDNPMVDGLDEVMDWPAVSDPNNPGYARIWQDIQGARDERGLIEGHGSGLWDIDRINAFAGAGLSSDHSTRLAQEAWDKMQHGVTVQMNDTVAEQAIPYFLKQGLKDWSNLAVMTDDRNVYDTKKTGTMDYHVRLAIKLGAPVEAAYAMASYYPARHAHLDPILGSIAPGRYADIILLKSVKDVGIKHVFVNGLLAATDGKYLLPIPKIDWPDWATNTINIEHPLVAKDFEIRAPAGRTTVHAAVQNAGYTDPVQKSVVLPVVEGVVQPDFDHDIIKVAIVDRYHGAGKLGKMFWTGMGPKTPNSAVATSLSHDLHNICVIGNSDAAMALAVNTIRELKGGIVLVDSGKVAASMRLEIGGLMTSRPVDEAAANLEALYAAADKMEWIGAPGFPRRAIAAMITCSPFTWRLVVPYDGNDTGLVSLQTGATGPIVW
jgi:adenine deaminase